MFLYGVSTRGVRTIHFDAQNSILLTTKRFSETDEWLINFSVLISDLNYRLSFESNVTRPLGKYETSSRFLMPNGLMKINFLVIEKKKSYPLLMLGIVWMGIISINQIDNTSINYLCFELSRNKYHNQSIV